MRLKRIFHLASIPPVSVLTDSIFYGFVGLLSYGGSRMAKFNIRVFYDGENFTASIYDGGRSVASVNVRYVQDDLHKCFGDAVKAWRLLAVEDDPSPRKRRRVVKEPEDAGADGSR